MSPLLKPCVTCGELSDGARCELHRPIPMPKTSSTSRGYDAAWRRLSERARKLQPFCTDCGTTDDLTLDHSPEAWERKERGLTIRLQDCAVVCRSCNAKRGAARGEGSRGTQLGGTTRGGRQSLSYTANHSHLGGAV